MSFVRLLALGAFVTTGACGFSNPGSGTGTLQVKAQVLYNAGKAGSSGPVTNANILVTKNGATTSSPTVTLQDADSGASFTMGAQDANGVSTAQIPGYHRRWILTVTSGSDNLTAKLESPGPFTLSNPLQDGQIVQSGGLTVNWQTQDGVKADKAEVDLSTIPGVYNMVQDTGSYEFPASQLKLGSQTVTVIRTNALVPAGAVGGAYSSVFQSGYEVDVDFTVGG